MRVRDLSDSEQLWIAAGKKSKEKEYWLNTDMIIGTPVFQSSGEPEKLINSVLAIRNQLDDGMSFKDLLFQVRQTIIEAGENQNYPFEVLVRPIGILKMIILAPDG
ncbi:MAG: hypothetical protein ACM3SY_02985 [Candidatus Omnitrophota bacterium]